MTNDISQSMIDSLLDRLDGSGSDDEWNAVHELRTRLGEQLPVQLLIRFRKAKKWQVRSSCIYHAVRYAKTSKHAVELALVAVRDRSQIVRYRGCMLLACSQCKELLPLLQVLIHEVDENTKADVLAAIDAIESQNQNFFVDRDHSGMVTLNIQ